MEKVLNQKQKHKLFERGMLLKAFGSFVNVLIFASFSLLLKDALDFRSFIQKLKEAISELGQ